VQFLQQAASHLIMATANFIYEALKEHDDRVVSIVRPPVRPLRQSKRINE